MKDPIGCILNRKQQEQFELYSELTGIPIEDCIQQALDDFEQTVIAAQLETVAPVPLVSIPRLTLVFPAKYN